MARIEWRESTLGMSGVADPRGFVDDVHLFSISWQGGDLPYAIYTELPALKINPAVDVKAARARCERVLESWLNRMLAATAPEKTGT